MEAFISEILRKIAGLDFFKHLSLLFQDQTLSVGPFFFLELCGQDSLPGCTPNKPQAERCSRRLSTRRIVNICWLSSPSQAVADRSQVPCLQPFVHRSLAIMSLCQEKIWKIPLTFVTTFPPLPLGNLVSQELSEILDLSKYKGHYYLIKVWTQWSA